MSCRARAAWAAVATMVWAAVSGCNRIDHYQTLFQLGERLSTAEIHREIDRIDLGTEDARALLGPGWSWNESSGETTYVWGLGPESWVHFYASRSRPIELEFRCRPLDVDGRAQAVDLAVNSVPLPPIRLDSGMREYELALPAAVVRPGRNSLRIRYAFARSPHELGASSDRRPLAVAWDWIELGMESTSRTPQPGAEGHDLSIPAGHLVDYYFFAHPGDRLRIDAVDNPDEYRVGLEIAYLDDRIDQERPLELGEAASGQSAILPVVEPGPARVRLRTFVRDGRNGSGAPIILSGARVEARGQPAAESVAPPSERWVELPEIERPDILIYLVDTLRADRIGSLGDHRDLTPAIDRLAAEGIFFTQAVAPSSWTKPSVTSLLTGLQPFAHGVNHRRHRLDDSFVTLAETVEELGYVSAGFATNPYLSAASGLRQGFDHFDLSDDPTEEVIDRALAWMRETVRNRPRLLYVHTVEPHDPYAPPEEFRLRFAATVTDPEIGSTEHIRKLGQHKEERSEEVVESIESLYDAEVAYSDRELGRLLEELRRSETYSETLIVFLSDHGEAFYEHGVMGHGWDLYRETTHVPLIVRLPGQKTGLRIERPVSITQVVPTVLDVLRVGASTHPPALSLLAAPRTADEPDSTPLGTPIYSYLDYDGRRGASVILGRWKLIEPVSSSFLPQRRLFDRLEDPPESRDLSARYPAMAGWLATLARQQLQALGSRPPAESVDFDETTERRLRALGYLE